jgi:CDP-2,3-bis-(O-geranylgeranyl)-sn-glycerol synthase
MGIGQLVLESLYFFLPAYCANMAPVVFARFNPLMQRVDMGYELNGRPLFGTSKTWGGLLYAILAGTLVFLLQQTYLHEYAFFQGLELFDYTEMTLWLGVLLGAGAILGDLMASFCKRRIGKESGAPWIPFDQLDFVVGGLLVASLVYFPGWNHTAVLAVLTPLFSLGANTIGYLMGLQDVWW